MHFHVCFEVSALGESSPTDEALERSFPHVNHKVSLQSGVVREDSATGRTVVVLLESARPLRWISLRLFMGAVMFRFWWY